MSKSLKALVSLLVGFILVSSGFIGGYLVSPNGRELIKTRLLGEMRYGRESATSIELGNRLDEVQAILESRALHPSELTSATVGAIDGLLGANGDVWGDYRSETETIESRQEMSGEFGGIGVVLLETTGTVSVREVYPDTPAERAGVREGDVFVSVDGEARDRWTSQEVSDVVRGKKGTEVTIVFRRPAEVGGEGDETLEKVIVRDTIPIRNVRTSLIDGVGYLNLESFNARSTRDVAEAISNLDAQGALGYVLDLRYNPGGLLDEAISVSSLFLDPGVVVQVEKRNGPIQKLETSGAKITSKPLVLLINGHSASASEILAGALKDYDRATLVGMQTFGKGSVQEIIDTSWGGSIKFTTAHYLSPKGNIIDQVGVAPDVEFEYSEMPRFDLKDMDEDPQLAKAVEVLKGLL